MHELSICQSIVDAVERHAAGRPVRAVHLTVGALRQIVPDTLAFCWELVTEGTPLAGSELVVDHVAAVFRCLPCNRTQTLTEMNLVCDVCGGSDLSIVAGEEFLITTLELAEA